MNTSDFISKYLEKVNVSHVFGVSGANIEELFFAIAKNNKTKIILAKNEYNASTMAIGSYWASKKIGVVLTTSGPGILNTLPILAEAFASNIPLVIISGLVPSAYEGFGGFQDTSGRGGTINIVEMVKPCSGFQAKIKNANEIPSAMAQAFSLAQRTLKPSVILIPKEIFSLEISNPSFLPDYILPSVAALEAVSKENLPTDLPTNLPTDLAQRTSDQNEQLSSFLAKLNESKRSPPLVVLGEDLIHQEDQRQLFEFIQKSAAAVAVTPISKGLFDHNKTEFVGLVGIMGHESVFDYLTRTDFVILVGTSFDVFTRFGIESKLSAKHVLVVHEKKGPGLYLPEGLTLSLIYGGIEETFAKMNKDVVIKSSPAGKLAGVQPVRSHPDDDNFLGESVSYNTPSIIAEIEKSLPEEAHVFVDAGNLCAFVIHQLKLSGKGLCYVSLGMGAMGNSIGVGIGSAVATRKRSYVFLGDGAFLMHGLEVHTAVEYGLPVTFFLLNNNSHGMCSTRENIFLGGETGVNTFKKSHYGEGLSKIFPGLISIEVNSLKDLRSCLNEVMSEVCKDSGPGDQATYVVSINTPANESPPFLSFQKNSKE